MKRSTLLSCLFALGFPVAAEAQESAAIVLRGYVPQRSSLHLIEANPLISNDLRSPVKDTLVARFLETTNAISGYTIKVISENARRSSGPNLVNNQNGTRVPYILSYGGRRLEFSGGEAGLTRAQRPRGARSVESELRLSTEGSERLPGGEYVDTIIVAIAAR